jgi:hypothetical protein
MDLEHIREDARRTSTECLLDRVTVFRAEMESPALGVLESELAARGVSGADVEAHAARRQGDGLLHHPDGAVVRCTVCPRPATARRWSWYRLWGWFLPLFPRLLCLCKEHDEQLPTDPHGRPLHYDTGVGARNDDPAV